MSPIVSRMAMIGLALGLLFCWTPPARSETPAAPEYPAYSGPRKTIAVSKFDAVGSFVGQYGGWDIGGGLAAMLASELARSNRFIVVERADLDTLLREKQMALSEVTAGASGRPLLAAQTFVRGSVTEFDQDEKGGGLSLGLKVQGVTGGGGRRTASGHVTIELRLIDAASGAVVATSKVEKKVKSSSLALQASKGLFAFGGDQFEQTSLGRASREAIQEAVAQITAGMERVPWQALVARFEGDRVYINAGRNANLASGARLRAVRNVNTITDPSSGEVLGGERHTVGDLVIEQVEDRYAVGRWLGHQPAQRGDIVQMLAGN